MPESEVKQKICNFDLVPTPCMIPSEPTIQECRACLTAMVEKQREDAKIADNMRDYWMNKADGAER